MSKVSRNTLTNEIVSKLTQEIISKRIAPGTTFDEARLGQQFGASRTPIREALRQLAASGLIELRPHRAPLVATADVERLREMFDVMAELEAMCAQRCCTSMRAAQRHELEELHRTMALSVRNSDVAAYRLGNIAFHGLIYEGANNAYLKQLARMTRERLAPYRGVQLEVPARLAHSYAEHEAIVIAILRGDQTGAATAIRQHLAVTHETLEQIVERN